jgi:hypothetical protein
MLWIFTQERINVVDAASNVARGANVLTKVVDKNPMKVASGHERKNNPFFLPHDI